MRCCYKIMAHLFAADASTATRSKPTFAIACCLEDRS